MISISVPLRAVASAACCVFLLAWSAALPTAPATAQMTRPVPAQVSACFSPGGDCAAHITAAVNGARREIRIQAMLFSIRAIQNAVVAAHKRGVDVAVILDPRQQQRATDACKTGDSDDTPAVRFAAAGIPVFIDNPEKTAHNKLIIIDRSLVIGGSFNYTYSADRKNAENVTFIQSPALAADYLQYWATRRAISRPFAMPNCGR